MGRKGKNSRKKSKKNKASRSEKGFSNLNSSSSAYTSILVLVLACAVAFYFSQTYSNSGAQSLQGDSGSSSTESAEDIGKTQRKQKLKPVSQERYALMAPMQIDRNCFPNGRCVNLRPWKSKRKYVKKEGCEDKRTECPQWAKRGQCDTNPGWMIVYCPVSCKACHLLDTKKRCRRQDDQTPVLKPGDIRDIFLGLPEKYPELKPRVLKNGTDELYFAVFENFLSEQEADKLIEWLEKLNPKRSTTQSDSWDGTGVMTQSHNSVRTSENAWCTQQCWYDPMVMGVVDRISEVTTVPPRNFENFQMVRYTKGQYYRTHNDCNPKDNSPTQTAGHRIFTVFLYLNDVEEGGQTDFPKLGERVTPRKGWAVFWPDVKNLNPDECDLRYAHHAMDVTKGMKYGANIWVHQWDYQTSSLWGCTGSFEG